MKLVFTVGYPKKMSNATGALSIVNMNKYLFVVGSDMFVKSKGGESE